MRRALALVPLVALLLLLSSCSRTDETPELADRQACDLLTAGDLEATGLHVTHGPEQDRFATVESRCWYRLGCESQHLFVVAIWPSGEEFAAARAVPGAETIEGVGEAAVYRDNTQLVDVLLPDGRFLSVQNLVEPPDDQMSSRDELIALASIAADNAAHPSSSTIVHAAPLGCPS